MWAVGAGISVVILYTHGDYTSSMCLSDAITDSFFNNSVIYTTQYELLHSEQKYKTRVICLNKAYIFPSYLYITVKNEQLFQPNLVTSVSYLISIHN